MSDEPSTKEVMDAVKRLEMKFNDLAEDFTELRYEVNKLEKLVERRT